MKQQHTDGAAAASTEQSVEDLNSEKFETLVNNENGNLVDEEGNGEFGSAEANQDDEINTEFVKTLAKNNFPFRGSHEKIYEESNGLFLSIIEMIGDFDPTMEEHLRQIEKVSLVELYNNPTTDSIAKSEAKSLVTRELETFEFLFSIVIWYNLLFHVNSISKLLQSEDMDIAVVVKQLDGLVKYVAMYKEVGFMEAMVETKEMASELGIESTFVEKRIISRKKQFDEDVSEVVTQSAEESFRVGYFLYFVDQAPCSLKNRFKQFKVYEANFGFLFDLKNCSDESLKAGCVNLEEFLKHGEISDIDGRDLLMELKVLKESLPKEVNKPIEMLNHLQLMANCFLNSWVAYRILLMILVTVASGKEAF
ncbi:uncharacterized protein LOC114273117 [Camellia sinensis]|uniref:uncharacterized protein LOC114273117 n=1 Tax=Camellia sinensis TaxID=4442 RepID=UPI001035F632|nr:uncharacterized protein LOC114273117 [Camellia sinensis]